MYVTTINKSGKILGAGVRIQIMDQHTTIIEGRRGLGNGFNSKNLRNWIFPKKNTMIFSGFLVNISKVSELIIGLFFLP